MLLLLLLCNTLQRADPMTYNWLKYTETSMLSFRIHCKFFFFFFVERDHNFRKNNTIYVMFSERSLTTQFNAERCSILKIYSRANLIWHWPNIKLRQDKLKISFAKSLQKWNYRINAFLQQLFSLIHRSMGPLLHVCIVIYLYVHHPIYPYTYYVFILQCCCIPE